MRNDNYSRALRLYLAQLVEALGLEICVAYREYLVNKQNIRVNVYRDRECQSHIHTRGIGSHRVVDEFAKLREINYLFQAAVDLLFCKTEDRGVCVNVLPAAHIWVKSRAEFKQARNAAVHCYCAAVGIHYPRQELESGTFSAAVVSDKTHSLAAPYLKGYVPENSALLVAVALSEKQPLL